MKLEAFLFLAIIHPRLPDSRKYLEAFSDTSGCEVYSETIQIAIMPQLFNLTLELTRLVPFSLASSDAVMNLARSLRNSGSDIVTEEDLATVLGRLRIAPQMASSFRTVVARNDSSVLAGALGITLEAGPGPTVSLQCIEAAFLTGAC